MLIKQETTISLGINSKTKLIISLYLNLMIRMLIYYSCKNNNKRLRGTQKDKISKEKLEV